MPQDALSSSLDAMEKGTLHSSDGNFDDDNSQSSSPPTSLSTQVLWFDAPPNRQTSSGYSLPLSSRSEISKPFVNIPEHGSILSKSSIVNRPCISYQRPQSVIQQPKSTTQRPEFFDNRPSGRSVQRPDTSFQQQTIPGGCFGNRPESAIHILDTQIPHSIIQQSNNANHRPEFFDNRPSNRSAQRPNTTFQQQNISRSFGNRPESSIHYEIGSIKRRSSSIQLPELDTNRLQKDVYSRSSSIQHPATVIYHGSIQLPERQSPDNAIYQADIPKSSTNRTEYAKYQASIPSSTTNRTEYSKHPAASITNSSVNRTEYAKYQASVPSSFTNRTERANHQTVIPRDSNQHQEHSTNHPENGIYCAGVPNQSVDFTIPPQNISIQRPDSVIVSVSTIRLPESLAKPSSHGIRHPDIFSQRSECFIKNSDIFNQRGECSIIQMT